MIYQVYFEIYGKKMMVKLDVESASVAKKQVKEAIRFYKIESKDQYSNDTLNDLMGIFGIRL
jgi:hypothetical protein